MSQMFRNARPPSSSAEPRSPAGWIFKRRPDELDLAAPASQEDVQGHGDGQQDERDRQHVRMQVGVQEREERELVDDLAGLRR